MDLNFEGGSIQPTIVSKRETQQWGRGTSFPDKMKGKVGTQTWASGDPQLLKDTLQMCLCNCLPGRVAKSLCSRV